MKGNIDIKNEFKNLRFICKNTYISDRTARILKKFDYTELPMVDQLIADLYILDDITRRDLFEYAKMLKKNHTSPERAADLKDIK